MNKPTALRDWATAVQKEEYEKQLNEYEKLDGIAQRIIITTISKKIMVHLINFDNGKSMWEKLTEIFEKKNDASLHIPQKKWHTLKMERSDDMHTHISKIEDMAYRLSMMDQKISEKMLISKIRITLPAEYNHFHSAWESTPENQQTKANLITRLTAEESRVHPVKENDECHALASLTLEKDKNKEKYNVNNNQKKGKCFICKKPNHWARDCRYNKNRSNNDREKVSKSVQGAGLISQALTTTTQPNEYTSNWYKDSGATNHMSNRKDWFVTYKPIDKESYVRMGNGELLKIHGKGDINVLPYNGEKWIRNHIKETLFVPELKYNLFSELVALNRGLKCTSFMNTCKFTKNNEVIAIGYRKDTELFTMKFKVLPPENEQETSNEISAYVAESLNTWHEKLAHQNFSRVKSILNSNGITFTNNTQPFCDACAIGKAHRLPFQKNISITNRIGEVIHVDVCGPMQESSMKGSRYFLLFKDDFSHFRYVYFIKTKSEVPECFENYIKQTEKHCPQGIKTIRSDNGLEFMNEKVSTIMKKYGIKHQRTVAYCPEQNGSAERENRTVVEAARTLLHAKKFKLHFWAEAVNTAIYVLNHTGTSSVKDKTPYEIWHNQKSSVHILHIFGEEVYVLNQKFIDKNLMRNLKKDISLDTKKT